ncbi:hypothetical protein DV515_00016079, partial [Chloebia gouldiae]
KDGLCGVGLNLEPAFLVGDVAQRRGESPERLGCGGIAVQLQLMEGTGEAPAKGKSRLSRDQRGCSKLPEKKKLPPRLKQEGAVDGSATLTSQLGS